MVYREGNSLSLKLIDSLWPFSCLVSAFGFLGVGILVSKFVSYGAKAWMAATCSHISGLHLILSSLHHFTVMFILKSNGGDLRCCLNVSQLLKLVLYSSFLLMSIFVLINSCKRSKLFTSGHYIFNLQLRASFLGIYNFE